MEEQAGKEVRSDKATLIPLKKGDGVENLNIRLPYPQPALQMVYVGQAPQSSADNHPPRAGSKGRGLCRQFCLFLSFIFDWAGKYLHQNARRPLAHIKTESYRRQMSKF